MPHESPSPPSSASTGALDKSASILIVGGGTFGLSTAWHLVREGYTRVKVIDRFDIPSPASDAYEERKAMRAQSSYMLYHTLALEAFEAWRTLEPFASADLVHASGWCLPLFKGIDPLHKYAVERAFSHSLVAHEQGRGGGPGGDGQAGMGSETEMGMGTGAGSGAGQEEEEGSGVDWDVRAGDVEERVQRVRASSEYADSAVLGIRGWSREVFVQGMQRPPLPGPSLPHAMGLGSPKLSSSLPTFTSSSGASFAPSAFATTAPPALHPDQSPSPSPSSGWSPGPRLSSPNLPFPCALLEAALKSSSSSPSAPGHRERDPSMSTSASVIPPILTSASTRASRSVVASPAQGAPQPPGPVSTPTPAAFTPVPIPIPTFTPTPPTPQLRAPPLRLPSPTSIAHAIPHLAPVAHTLESAMFSPSDGWVEARRAIAVLAADARRRGVEFVCGAAGHAVRLVVPPKEAEAEMATSSAQGSYTSPIPISPSSSLSPSPSPSSLAPPTSSSLSPSSSSVSSTSTPTPTLSLPPSSTPQQPITVEAEDGTLHIADKVVLAIGNDSQTLLDFEGQLIEVSHVVAEVRLNDDEERAWYASMPVIETTKEAQIFPPYLSSRPNETDDPTSRQDTDAGMGTLKVCSDTTPIVLNPVDGIDWGEDVHISLSSRSDASTSSAALSSLSSYQSGTSPSTAASYAIGGAREEDERRTREEEGAIREVLAELVPALKGRRLEGTRVVWDNKCFDGEYIVSAHPSCPHLFVATAGNGHAFRMLPIIGRYVVRCLEGRLGGAHAEAWRWRPESVPPEGEGDE